MTREAPGSAHVRRWPALLAVAIMAAALSVTLPGDAWASPAVGGFTVLPVPTADDSVSRGYFNPTLAVGATQVEKVVVGNDTGQPLNLIVSPVDGLTGVTSGSVFANRQDPVRETGTWLSVGISTLRVPAHAKVPISFRVKVPTGASAGEHLAGLAIENANPQTSGGGMQITQVLRMVVGVLVRVPGPASFEPTLRAVRLIELPGPKVAAVIAELANVGAALGKPTLTVSLVGPGGYRRSVTRVLDTILPGDAISFPFSWPDELVPGHYDITAGIAGADPAKVSTVHGQGTLTTALKGTNQPSQPSASPGASPGAAAGGRPGGGTPWVLLAVVAVVGIVGGLTIRRRPLRRRAPARRALHRRSAAPVARDGPSGPPDESRHLVGAAPRGQ